MNGQIYYYKLQTSNYFGDSIFSSESFIVAGLPPSQKGGILTYNRGTLLEISWGDSFDLQDLPFTNLTISIINRQGKEVIND